jgi:uncharacterized protein YukE
MCDFVAKCVDIKKLSPEERKKLSKALQDRQKQLEKLVDKIQSTIDKLKPTRP